MRKSQHFWPRNWEKKMFWSSILNKLSVFCAIIYSNTNILQLFCENSSLNSANFTDRAIFTLILENLARTQFFCHKCFLCHLWQTPCLFGSIPPLPFSCECLLKTTRCLFCSKAPVFGQKVSDWNIIMEDDASVIVILQSLNQKLFTLAKVWQNCKSSN